MGKLTVVPFNKDTHTNPDFNIYGYQIPNENLNLAEKKNKNILSTKV
jgi:hypothetical protein